MCGGLTPLQILQGGHSKFVMKFQDFSRTFPGLFKLFPGLFRCVKNAHWVSTDIKEGENFSSESEGTVTKHLETLLRKQFQDFTRLLPNFSDFQDTFPGLKAIPGLFRTFQDFPGLVATLYYDLAVDLKIRLVVLVECPPVRDTLQVSDGGRSNFWEYTGEGATCIQHLF